MRAQRRPGRSATRVHQALLAGLLSHVGCASSATSEARRGGRDAGRRPREYLGARGARFAIFPGLGAVQEAAALVMAAELVETSRLWARVERRDRAGVGRAARRAPGQAHLQRAALVEEAGRGDGLRAGHAVRRPAGRRPDASTTARIDPALSRELFIRHALVEGDWDTHHRFFARTTPRCSTRSRSWSTGPAAATSSSTTRRSSTSTTPGSRPTSCPAALRPLVEAARAATPGPAHLRRGDAAAAADEDEGRRRLPGRVARRATCGCR